MDINDLLILVGISSLGAMIGAKALYFVVSFRQIDFSKLLEWDYLSGLLRGGFVFYGGLLGGGAAYLGIKWKIPMAADYSSLIATLIPLGHGFGRIGCHFAGCCYGKICQHAPYVVYRNSVFAPNHVRLFPVQLAESFGNFLIFFVLLYFLLTRGSEKARNGERYLILYSFLRFFLEFFRGDILRGEIGIFSTSQWISLILIFSVILFRLLKKKKRA